MHLGHTYLLRALLGILPPVNYPVCMNKDGAGFASNIVRLSEKWRGHVRRVEYSDGTNPILETFEQSADQLCMIKECYTRKKFEVSQ